MVALILLGLFILVIYLIKRFLDKYGKFLSSSLLFMFIKEVREIEKNGGKVIVRMVGDYHAIILTNDGKIINSISVDIPNNKIYSGIVNNNKPNWDSIIYPMRLPINSNMENLDKIHEFEDRLVEEIMQIIVKYKIN
jgi:hypothetical protein